MKNIVSMFYKVSYIVLGIIGLLLSTHFFTEHIFYKDFYIYYTNLTNVFCIVVMYINLKEQLKEFSTNYLRSFKKNILLSNLNVLAAILITITLFVYNICLADFTIQNYWGSLYNLLFHIILPIWFVLYVLGSTFKFNWYMPLIAYLCQCVYVVLIFLRSLVLNGSTGRVIYPYFFLNFETLGFWGSFKWLMLMLIFSLTSGYLFGFVMFVANKIKTKATRNTCG